MSKKKPKKKPKTLRDLFTILGVNPKVSAKDDPVYGELTILEMDVRFSKYLFFYIMDNSDDKELVGFLEQHIKPLLSASDAMVVSFNLSRDAFYSIMNEMKTGIEKGELNKYRCSKEAVDIAMAHVKKYKLHLSEDSEKFYHVVFHMEMWYVEKVRERLEFLHDYFCNVKKVPCEVVSNPTEEPGVVSFRFPSQQSFVSMLHSWKNDGTLYKFSTELSGQLTDIIMTPITEEAGLFQLTDELLHHIYDTLKTV